MNQEAMYIETAAAYPSLRQEAADEAHVLARRGRRRTNRDDAGVCQQRRGLDRPDVDAGVGVPRSRAASCRWRRPVAYSPSARVTDLFATIKLIELDQVTAILQRRMTECSNSTNQLQGRKKTNAECSSSSSTNWLQDKKKIMHPMIRKTTMAQHTKRLMISVAVFTKDRRHTYWCPEGNDLHRPCWPNFLVPITRDRYRLEIIHELIKQKQRLFMNWSNKQHVQ